LRLRFVQGYLLDFAELSEMTPHPRPLLPKEGVKE
jgi:hypothetical protein